MADSQTIPSDPRFQDLTGSVYGRLLVQSYAGRRGSGSHKFFWKCECECGKEITVNGHLLRTGRTQSCGCLRAEQARVANMRIRTGISRHPLMRTYFGMLSRCANPNHHAWHNYGGRGIKVCDRWLGNAGFSLFVQDVGIRPTKRHSLERINVNGDYEPSNCCWATAVEQRRNTRFNVLLTFRGETRCVAEWAQAVGIKHSCLKERLRRGWSVEKALTTSVKKGG